MKIKDITKAIEAVAPLAYQESYDNAGLITGNPNWDANGAVLALDCLEDVVDEAIANNVNMVIAHHPILFYGLKSLTGASYVERTLIKAIKHDVAIYAAHTNLDNVVNGVNAKIAEKLGLQNIKVLQPKQELLFKLVTFVPESHLGEVQNALYGAGAGQVGHYDRCSFSTSGTGTYRPGDNTQPFAGQKGQEERAAEIKLEVILPRNKASDVLQALHTAHPYEEVAYDLIPLNNSHQQVGSGAIGELSGSMPWATFLQHIKAVMKTGVIKHTQPIKEHIQTVAICGGAGSFLTQAAKKAGADVFITADVKYHEFFDADGKLTILDIGHYESEQFTNEVLAAIISKKFPNFALHFSEVKTNPVNYF